MSPSPDLVAADMKHGTRRTIRNASGALHAVAVILFGISQRIDLEPPQPSP